MQGDVVNELRGEIERLRRESDEMRRTMNELREGQERLLRAMGNREGRWASEPRSERGLGRTQGSEHQTKKRREGRNVARREQLTCRTFTTGR